jgi:hypothetical protein
MRRLVIAATIALLTAAAVAVPVARALRGANARRPSVSAPLATDVGPRSARLTAVVDTAGLGGSVTVAYGRTSLLTTKVPLGTVSHETGAGRMGAPVRGLAPGTTYHFRMSLTTVSGTVSTPDATFTTTRAATARCRVPALKGRTLSSARRALRRAGCATGHVRRPAHVRRGARMVVAAQSVPAGRVRAAGTLVGLRLRAVS